MDPAAPGLPPCLPVGAALNRRPVTVDDLPAVIALLAASDRAVLGRTDFTEDEVASDLRNERFVHEGWYDGAGALVAYGWVSRVAESHQVDLDVYVHPDHDPAAGGSLLGAGVLAQLESRGLDLSRSTGHDDAVFDTGVYRQDARTRSWLTARDWQIGTTFVRMRIDFDGPDAAPTDLSTAAPGVKVRTSEGADADLRIAHALDEEAFAEHYMHVPSTLEQARERFFQHGAGWSSLWLAELDGEPVGLLVGTRQFVEDERCGYVARLGVRPAGRGRGVGRALLRTYFAAQQAEGRSGVLLHVDVANVTNALAVYESVGMRPVLEIDAWTKRVTAGAPPR